MIRAQGRPLNRLEDVPAVQRLRPGGAGVAERRVEREATTDLRPPRHRFAVDGGEDVRRRAGLGVEAVPLVGAGPAARQALGGGMAAHEHVLALERALPVRQEAGAAEHVAVERPVAIGVRGRVDRHHPAAGPHPALERGPPAAAQHARAVRLQQHHDVDVAQPLVAEPRRVLRQLGVEPLAERRAAGLDRVGVAVRRGAREHQHVDLRRAPAAPAGRRRQREDRGAHPHARRCYGLGSPAGASLR
jgi:hypothetical protein